jgi:uncharacterized RDD family membrane protein YckC
MKWQGDNRDKGNAMQNELDPSQENTVEHSGQLVSPERVFTFPPIAGFWRRFFAWLVDTIIVGIAGQIIGFAFSPYLYSIGPNGRPIGLLFILPYFGIMNSKIGGGQTLGKRLMKIAVRNKNNEPIGLWRSVVRILLLGSPALFNSWTIAILLLALPALLYKGWAIPIIDNYVVTWFVSLWVFGFGGAIIYSMVFNSKPRQGIHDLLLGTYVVRLSGKPIGSFPKTSRIHWAVTGAWIGIVAIATLALVLLAPPTISKTPMAYVQSPFDILQHDPRFYTVSINDNTCCYSNGMTTRSLNITVWYKGKIDEGNKQEVANSIVKTVLENEKYISYYDEIKVDMTSAYEIGIATGHINISVSNSVDGWRKQIYPNGASGFIPLLMAKALAIP